MEQFIRLCSFWRNG